MLLSNDPFRDMDTLFDRIVGQHDGLVSMPIDAYRRGNDVWVHIDLPGIAADSIDLNVERNVLTVSADRHWHREDGDQMYVAERPRGSFRRQIHLGDHLDTDHVEADYADGVLTVRIPVADDATPRKIPIGGHHHAIDVESSVTNT